MAPRDVGYHNYRTAFKNIHGVKWPGLKHMRKRRAKVRLVYKPGDNVRITSVPAPFKKGYIGYFGRELFTVKTAIRRDPPVYTLTDEDGDAIKGTFYKEQLTRVRPTG